MKNGCISWVSFIVIFTYLWFNDQGVNLLDTKGRKVKSLYLIQETVHDVLIEKDGKIVKLNVSRLSQGSLVEEEKGVFKMLILNTPHLL